jgi:hypothetical protein
MAKLTGTNPDQVPTNADLGTMAYQDKDNVRVSNITVSDAPLEAGNLYGNLLVKSDVNDKAIFLEQNDGNRNWQIGINNTGDLQFFNSGSSTYALMIDDNNVLYVDPVSAGLAAVYGLDNNQYYIGVGSTRAKFGYDGSDAVMQGTAGKGIKILADDATFGSGKGITISTSGEVQVTHELTATSYNETYAAVTSSSNATTVDCEAGNAFSHTLTENTTFTFSNPPASGTAYSFSIEIIQDASASGYTVTWPSSVDWPSATAPTLTATASAKDVFVFTTRDGGSNWYGFTAGQALG